MASVSIKKTSDVNLGQTNGTSGSSGQNTVPTKTIYFIEPLDGLPVDNKDLFIYVNLTATKKARSVLQLTKETNPNIRSANTNSSEINLIGYKQDKDGNIFMTTDWSVKPQFGKVTDLDPKVVNNVFEGFGVTDIDINITAMNPPTVNIKFIDTRGGGLFDQESFSNLLIPTNAYQNTSPYAIFFEMPPPLFYLTLKGFYGNPVTLCLYLLKWDGNFNSETGNFEISANFIGYTFAFLQDIKIGHLIAASNTIKGREKLREVTNRPTNDGGYIFPYITLDDLALKFQRITINREKEQKDSQIFNQLKVINEQISYIKNFRSLIGYVASEANTNNLYGSSLDTTYLVSGRQQIFFRDVGIIAEGAKDNYKNVISIITNGAKKYKEFKESQQGANSGFLESGYFTLESLQIPKPEFKNIPESDVKNNVTDALVLVNKYLQQNEPNSNIPLVTMTDFTAKTENNWSIDSKVGVINLKNDRKKIDDCLNALLTKKQQIEDQIKLQQAKEITDTLGFTPNIRNIIGILCNNIEMFLSLIYDVGRKAESKDKERYAQLGGNFTSDTPKVNVGENIVYPFPKVVDKDYKEIYLGDDRIKLSEDNYPEITFVNELCRGLVYSIKQSQELENSKTSTEKIEVKYGFPLNPIDINVAAYNSVDGLQNEQPSSQFPNGTINSEIVDVIIKRMFISYVLSNYRSDNFNEIANLEAINFFTSLESEKFVNIIRQVTAQNIVDYALGYGIINNVSGTTDYQYYLPFSSIPPFDVDYNGSTNSGNRVWDNKVILKDKVIEELKLNDTSSPQIKKFTSPKRTTKYIWRGFDNKNVFLNKTYLTLATFKEDSVKGSILSGKDLENFNLLESYSINTLSDISLVPTFQKYFQLPVSVGPTINFIPQIKSSEVFTKSSIYLNSNNFGKAYLILSSFLMEDEKILLNEIKNDYSKIIRLPQIYLLWLGANSYRFNNPTEILKFDSDFPAVPKDSFYYITRKKYEGNSNNRLCSLMENLFANWVYSSDFLNLMTRFEYYLNTENLGEDDKKIISDQLKEILFNEYDLIVNNPNQTLNQNFTNTISLTEINSYINTFKQKYDSISSGYVQKQKEVTEDKTKVALANVVKDPDVKKAFYIDLKHIYDNWIAGNENDKIYTCCKTIDSKSIKLFDLFKFVDKFRNPIAGDAIININSFNDLVSKRDVGLFSFISKILTDSYFMHFTLPIYVEYYKANEVKSIFEPQVTLEKLRQSPTLLCVYNGPPSSSIKSGNYVDDSFKFNDTGSLPKSVYETSGEKNPYLIAFNVNYGSQFQSIFKNVQVSTQESKITGEYITLLSNYTVGTGESKPLIKDNSLFTIMRSRSYTSTIQMLGNMMIQPQMYYQLNNIPFFGGSYMIMNVSHSIKPNSMYTTFKGVRQNNNPVEVVTEVTSFLSFQFDQGVSTGFSFTEGVELVKTTPLDETQLSAKTTANVTTKAKLDFRPTIGTNILRAFNDKTELHKGIDIEVDSPNTQITSVNIKGTILYNLQGNDTTNGKLIIKHDPDTDGYTYFTAYFGLKNNTFSNGGQITGEQKIGNPSTYNFNSSTSQEKTAQPSQPNAIRPKYTFEVETDKYNDGTIAGFTAKIYNNGKYIGLQRYSNTYGSSERDNTGRPISQIDVIKRDLEFDAQRGFCGDSFISADSKDVFGARTQGTCYPGYRDFDNQQNATNTVTNETKKESAQKYYYHYEVRRTKGQINSYEEFLNSPQIEIIDPQQFSSNLNIKNMDTALHDNTIYEEKIKGIEAERKLPFIGGYENDVFNVKIDPALETWKIFSLEYDYRGTSDCIDEGYDQTFDRQFISNDQQSITITKQDLLNDVYCLGEPLSAQTGTYYFNITVYANPYTSDGKLDVKREPSQAIKSYKIKFTI